MIQQLKMIICLSNNLISLNELKLCKGDSVFVASQRKLPVLAMVLKNSEDFNYEYLSDITVVDLLNTNWRFAVVYRFSNLETSTNICVITCAVEGISFFSIEPVYTAANWPERENWEMMGVSFDGNSSMSRLLTDYGFRGFPLRKDFPLSGYKELFFSYHNNLLESVRPEFMQKLRRFEFSTFNWSDKNTTVSNNNEFDGDEWYDNIDESTKKVLLDGPVVYAE
jgi:NADH-quinone oxidoreductase subunit C